MEKPYILFTDGSHYACSEALTQAVESPEDLRPVAFTLRSFSEMQQRWSATKKEANAVYKFILKFDLYLIGAKCVLHCDHKPRGLKIPKLNRCSMELADYNVMFVHIKYKHNILADAIFKLKTLNIYKEPLENLKAQEVSNLQSVLQKYVPLACTPFD